MYRMLGRVETLVAKLRPGAKAHSGHVAKTSRRIFAVKPSGKQSRKILQAWGRHKKCWASGHPDKDGYKDTRDEHLNHSSSTRTYENIFERDWTSGSFGKRDYFNDAWRSFSGGSSCLDISSCMGLHSLSLCKSNGFHPLMAIRRSAFSRWKKF